MSAEIRIKPQEPLAYEILPFRFAQIPGTDPNFLVTSEAGEFQFLSREILEALVARKTLPTEIEEGLESRQIIARGDFSLATRLLATKLRTRKSFLRDGPSLHIFVVTLRCDHSCTYCQVSRSLGSSTQFKMTPEVAARAVDRLFESPARTLTVEFQGGEPLFAFDRIRQIVDLIVERNRTEGRRIGFTITSTLHHLTDEILEFLRQHEFHVSTSLDGPAGIHDANRPLPTRDSHAKTLEGIRRVWRSLGATSLNALTTLTRRSLQSPEEVIDEYVRLGFRSVFLRPLSHFGFAARSARQSYPAEDYLPFYERALSHLLKINAAGYRIEEVYTGILLRSILTSFPTSYVDLRSPLGAGLGTLVYNYDGDIYASDEGRMLAEMGDYALRLGCVADSYEKLITSEAMQLLAASGFAESLPGCADCAFVPYCGVDPASAISRENDPVGHRTTSDHCRRHTGIFNVIFRHLSSNDPAVMRILNDWAFGRGGNQASGICDVPAT